MSAFSPLTAPLPLAPFLAITRNRTDSLQRIPRNWRICPPQCLGDSISADVIMMGLLISMLSIEALAIYVKKGVIFETEAAATL